MNRQKDRVIANNKRARHEYFIETTIEAGIVLVGTEVKSIRQGKVSIQESYVAIKHSEAWLYGLHISPYDHGNIYNVDPIRPRKLLLHRKELRKLEQGVTRDGYTIVPLCVVIRRGMVKVDIALARGKKLYDKRHTIAERDAKRRIEQAVRRK